MNKVPENFKKWNRGAVREKTGNVSQDISQSTFNSKLRVKLCSSYKEYASDKWIKKT
jgi:hypothetical protein